MEIQSKSEQSYQFPTNSGMVLLEAKSSVEVQPEQYQQLNENEGFKTLISQKEIVLIGGTDDGISTPTTESLPENSDSIPKRTKG